MYNGNQPLTKNLHEKFMFEAFKLAEKAYSEGEIPVGAIVVYQNRIIGKGYNQVELLKDPTAHAEMLAISAACATLQKKYLTGCSLYVTLEPCSMCAGAAVWSKLDRIIFGAMDEKAGGCGTMFNITENSALNHRIEIIQGVMEYDCQYLLKQFFKSRRI
jgi:tRNA(adenine34) deaminase